jgi:hypothetical protein
MHAWMTWRFARSAIAMTCLSALIAAEPRAGRAEPHPSDPLVWQEYQPALLAFEKGGSRREFLETCQRLRAKYSGSQYDAQLDSLIVSLEREQVSPVPAFLKKDPTQRTREEEIRFWIYQLRDLTDQSIMKATYTTAPLSFSLLGFTRPTAADRLVAIGPAAIPFLIGALEDDTPTRALSIGGGLRSRAFPGVWRRQDLAIDCLEEIVGCDFYDRHSSRLEFCLDTEERRQSVLDNIQEWWRQSQGAAQGDMLRNQIKLMTDNVTLDETSGIHTLKLIAMIEGPDALDPEAASRIARSDLSFHSSGREFLEAVDFRLAVREHFRHFWADDGMPVDYAVILQYGDKRVYQEIVRRLAQTTAEDPKAPKLSDYDVWLAAKYGGKWAIPLVASRLSKVEMGGMREVNGQLHPFSTADEGIETFQKLTGQEFGYRRDGTVDERLVAIQKARDWWDREGRTRLADEIAQDHPPVEKSADLLLSDADLQAMVDAIRGSDPERRASSLDTLGPVYSHQVQRALLDTVEALAGASEQQRILDLLEPRPALWHLPTLMRLFGQDGDLVVRTHAGRIIAAIVRDPNGPRFEVCERALEQARTLTTSPREPPAVRETAVSVLIERRHFTDAELLRQLGRDPQLGKFNPLQQYLVEMAEQQERWGPEKPPME